MCGTANRYIKTKSNSIALNPTESDKNKPNNTVKDTNQSILIKTD